MQQDAGGGEARLRGADVARRLVAPDVLLARLHGHAQRRLAARVAADADDAAGHEALVLRGAREERGVRPRRSPLARQIAACTLATWQLTVHSTTTPKQFVLHPMHACCSDGKVTDHVVAEVTAQRTAPQH